MNQIKTLLLCAILFFISQQISAQNQIDWDNNDPDYFQLQLSPKTNSSLANQNLPLGHFSAHTEGRTTFIEIQLQKEEGLEGLEIHYSLDAMHWLKLKTLDFGNTSNKLLYFNADHSQLISGAYFYKVKRVYKDGSIHLSDIQQVEILSPKPDLAPIKKDRSKKKDSLIGEKP